MTYTIFKKTVFTPLEIRRRRRMTSRQLSGLSLTAFISLLGHLTLFTIFSFSFGARFPKPNYARVTFWGAILESADLISSQNFKSRKPKKEVFLNRLNSMALADITNKEYRLGANYYLKPQPLAPQFYRDKLALVPKQFLLSTVQEKKRPQIMFYPHLPSHFLFYFKDRESVHIELIFNIVSTRSLKYTIIKRKISSGNLEADLLAMRYINHYLFIQQAVFPVNKWQTVKIDLSKKE